MAVGWGREKVVTVTGDPTFWKLVCAEVCRCGWAGMGRQGREDRRGKDAARLGVGGPGERGLCCQERRPGTPREDGTAIGCILPLPLESRCSPSYACRLRML